MAVREVSVWPFLAFPFFRGAHWLSFCQVTYGANQWHAPMIALRDHTTFCVMNGENETTDDLEEFFFGEESQPVVRIGDLDRHSLELAGRGAKL